MKKFLLSTVALATMTAGAMAADLPARRMAPAPFAAVPMFTWTGFYVGVNVGVGWNDRKHHDHGFLDPGLVTARSVGSGGGLMPVVPAGGGFFGQSTNAFGGRGGDDATILGGAQIGYNIQLGAGSGLVVGVEADLQAIGNRGRNRGFFGGGFGDFGNAVPGGTTAGQLGGIAPVGFVGSTAPIGFSNAGAPGNVAFFNNNNIGVGGDRRDPNWFGTARVRVGFAFDRVLVYATGGLAFTDRRDRDHGFFGTGGFRSGAEVPQPFYVSPGARTSGSNVVATNANVGFVGRGSSDNFGWALGGGVEYAFTNNMSAKIEGLWVNFGRNRGGLSGGCCVAGDVVGVTNVGGPIIATNTTLVSRKRNDSDIALVRVGLNWRFTGL